MIPPAALEYVASSSNLCAQLMLAVCTVFFVGLYDCPVARVSAAEAYLLDVLFTYGRPGRPLLLDWATWQRLMHAFYNTTGRLCHDETRLMQVRRQFFLCSPHPTHNSP